ncbi:hypothetical protein SUGI_0628380 [Cryptomeria japonica]|nr:hypothetical protein SUGI_0628380 [Cryptomeria japonica]
MAASKVVTQDDLKKIKLAADKAMEYVESGMDIVSIPTSKWTTEQVTLLGIPLLVLDNHPKIDLANDGVDEVYPELNSVKGCSGTILREKMVEAASSKFVVVVDESKLVEGLGDSKLAIHVELDVVSIRDWGGIRLLIPLVEISLGIQFLTLIYRIESGC